VAFPKKADVDSNYDRLAKMLLEGAIAAGSPGASTDGRFPPIPAIASHDPKRIKYARQLIDSLGLPKQAVEFQMLYGIRRDLQEELAAAGYACGFTFHMALTGIPILCAVWANVRRTSGFLYPISCENR